MCGHAIRGDKRGVADALPDQAIGIRTCSTFPRAKHVTVLTVASGTRSLVEPPLACQAAPPTCSCNCT
eukprot:9473966-Pyramimonas_sp.AAC.1